MSRTILICTLVMALMASGCGVFNALSDPPDEEEDTGPGIDVDPLPDDAGEGADAEVDAVASEDADAGADAGACDCIDADNLSYSCDAGECVYECDEGWLNDDEILETGCRCSTSGDLDEFPKCPGEDIDGIVFVDAHLGGNALPGIQPDAPVRTLDTAIEVAEETDREIILLADTSDTPEPYYEIETTIESPISIYGGRTRAEEPNALEFPGDWSESEESERSIIVAGGLDDAEDFAGLEMVTTLRVERPTADAATEAVFSNIEVRPPELPDNPDQISDLDLWGLSVATVKLINIADGGLQLLDSHIEGGVAAHGKDGDHGANGEGFDTSETIAADMSGGDGNSFDSTQSWTEVLEGGPGGTAPCEEAGDGGDGGTSWGNDSGDSSGGDPGDAGHPGTDVDDGAPNDAGQGGQPGISYFEDETTLPENRSPPVDGASGAGGDGGEAVSGDDIGQLTSQFTWVGSSGEAGDHGGSGGGGGGGGAGGSRFFISDNSQDFGGSGGGGGAGGCGGDGGEAGMAGGASFAVLLIDADVIFDGVSINAGSGGDGGDGGHGGCGALGGPGGDFAPGTGEATHGQTGANGGLGGGGGGGAGGLGGPTLGIATAAGATTTSAGAGIDFQGFEASPAGGGDGGDGGVGSDDSCNYEDDEHCACPADANEGVGGDAGPEGIIEEVLDFDEQ